MSWMRMERPMNFNEIYREKKEYIENVLKKYLPEQEGYQKVIMEAMEYSLMAGGKRLRPVLMLETYRLFGGEDRAIEPFLAAIEMIHTYSLVHDAGEVGSTRTHLLQSETEEQEGRDRLGEVGQLALVG